MAQPEKIPRRDFVTKEIFILMVPFLSCSLWTLFYEGGFATVFGIPVELISLNLVNVMLSNRLALITATIAFLWIGLYYNLLPSASSTLFRGFITLALLIVLGLGFFFGRTDALHHQEFLVANTTPETVVLKIYGENIVTAPFNRATKSVYKSFNILKLGHDKNLTLTLQNIGPLNSEVSH